MRISGIGTALLVLAGMGCSQLRILDVDAPTQVWATVSSGRVVLDWSPVEGATGYDVFYATATGVSSRNYSSLPGGATQASWAPQAVLAALSTNSTYYFVVRARLSDGAGKDSGQLSATVRPFPFGGVLWEQAGAVPGESFGGWLSGGDPSGNGKRGLYVGAPDDPTHGPAGGSVTVYDLSGGSQALFPAGLSSNGNFGAMVVAGHFGPGAGDTAFVGAPGRSEFWWMGSPGWAFTGPGQFIPMGLEVGDVNGDGWQDLVGIDWTEAFVFHGGPAGPAAPNSPDEDINWTSSSMAVGDFDGDGYDDVLLGDSYDSRFDLFRGGAGTLFQSTPFQTVKGGAGSGLGDYVAFVGDVNGDGYGDFLIADGPPNASLRRLHLFLGGPTGLTETASFPAPAPDYNWSDANLSIVGADLNGDGLSDVVIGESGWGAGGRVRVFFGTPSGIAVGSSAADWTLMGSPSEELGYSVAVVGDINGDRLPDFAVGIPGRGVGGAAVVYGSAPARAITASAGYVLSGMAGQTVTPVMASFADELPGPHSCVWEWGDGGTDSIPDCNAFTLDNPGAGSPSHTYQAPGRYLVRLTVTAGDGNFSQAITQAEIQ